METIEMKEANLSFAKMRNGILFYGIICSSLYISFLLIMKMCGLSHVVELRFVNYFILFFVTFYQIRHWIVTRQGYLPFLQVICISLFTGIWSFILFCVYLFINNKYDPEFADLFIHETKGMFPAFPCVIVLLEGSAASVVTAYIHMQYFRSYEEGERSLVEEDSINDY